MAFFPEIDLGDPDNFIEGVPHHWFAKLRAEAPVYFHPEPDGPGFGCVTRYEDLKHVSRVKVATPDANPKSTGLSLLQWSATLVPAQRPDS